MNAKLIALIPVLTFSLSAYSQRRGVDTIQNSIYYYQKFVPGKVLFKTGVLENASLNYDTNTSEIAYEQNGEKMIVSNPEDIDTVYIEDKKFIAVYNVFYEIVTTTGNYSLLAWHKSRKVPMEATADHNGSSTQSSSVVSNTVSNVYTRRIYSAEYGIELYDKYLIKPASEKILYKADNEKSFIKVFSSDSEKIKSYLQANKFDFSNKEDLTKLFAMLRK